jgi:hypothetical protein
MNALPFKLAQATSTARGRTLVVDDSPLEPRLALDNSNQPPATPAANPSRPLDWTMLALWLSIVFCFAALAFALYVIWAKCGGT